MLRSILALSLLAFPACLAAALLEPADSILLNGQVLVFSGPERHDSVGPPRFEQAVAIRDGRIVFVGTSEEARKYAGPATSVTELRGRMVMPGIVDGHFHGTRYTDCDLGYEGGTIAAGPREAAGLPRSARPGRVQGHATSGSTRATSSPRRSRRAGRS